LILLQNALKKNMYLEKLFLLLLLWEENLAFEEVQFPLTIPFSGAIEFCRCDACARDLECVDHYVWLDSGANPNHGQIIQTFNNPLPVGFLMKAVNVSLLGTFHCR
jgi:hypothetical protein